MAGTLLPSVNMRYSRSFLTILHGITSPRYIGEVQSDLRALASLCGKKERSTTPFHVFFVDQLRGEFRNTAKQMYMISPLPFKKLLLTCAR